MSGTVFDRAFVQFTAGAGAHGNLVPKESLGVIVFRLLIYPEDFPVPESEKIIVANIGGFEVEAQIVSPAEIHTFALPEDESSLLLQRFIKNEVVDFSLRFATGEKRHFKIYPSGDRTFCVWAEMFNTCIRERPN